MRMHTTAGMLDPLPYTFESVRGAPRPLKRTIIPKLDFLFAFHRRNKRQPIFGIKTERQIPLAEQGRSTAAVGMRTLLVRFTEEADSFHQAVAEA